MNAVLSHLPSGSVPFVLDLADFTHSFGASLVLPGASEQAAFHLPSGETLAFSKLQVVWWWRPRPVRRRYDLMPYHSDFALQESEDFLAGLLSILPAGIRWYNHRESSRIAANKICQISAAVESGLKVPETLITTDEATAIRFVDQFSPVVLKPLQRSGSGWYPTQKVNGPKDAALTNALSIGPVYLQRYIQGPEDFRIVAMDEYTQAVSFDLSTCAHPEDSSLDQNTSCRPATIPDQLAERIVECLRRMNLRYGACDFRKDAQGNFFFFEVNPGGYFLHLDRRAGTNIAQNIARILSR